MTDELNCGPFALKLAMKDGGFAGFGAVRMGTLALRAGTRPALPVIEAADGSAFDAWLFAATRREGPDHAVLELAGRGRPTWRTGTRNCYGDDNPAPLPPPGPGPAARLRIEFRADTWMGLPRLRTRILFESDGPPADAIVERWTWEPDGTTEGATYFAPRWGVEFGGWRWTLRRNGFFSTRDAMRVAGRPSELGSVQPRAFGGPAMDFIYSRQTALCLFREDPANVRGYVEKRRGETLLHVVDQCLGSRRRRLESPWLSIVVFQARRPLDREAALDLWARLWDAYADGLARRAGVPRPAPLPAIYCESWNLGSRRFFAHQAKFLRAFAETGARRLLLHTLPHPHKGNNCCGIYDFTILESEGGMAALRHYTDAAHRLGLEVFAWVGGALHRASPRLRQHPDWFVRDAAGALFGGGYGELAALDFGHPEVRAFYLRQLRALLHEGGVDGFWIDSLLNLHGYGVNRRRATRYGGPGPHERELLACWAELARAGAKFLMEGVSPLGTAAGGISFVPLRESALTGNLLFGALGGGAELLYRTNLWLRGREQAGGRGIGADLYFRALANAAPLALYYDTSDHAHRLSSARHLDLPEPVAIPGYRALNDLYGQALPLMRVRQILARDRGVLWHPENAAPDDLSSGETALCPARAPGPRVLFSYRKGPLELPGEGWNGAIVTDLATGRQAPVRDGRIAAAAQAVYRIERPGRPNG